MNNTALLSILYRPICTLSETPPQEIFLDLSKFIKEYLVAKITETKKPEKPFSGINLTLETLSIRIKCRKYSKCS